MKNHYLDHDWWLCPYQHWFHLKLETPFLHQFPWIVRCQRTNAATVEVQLGYIVLEIYVLSVDRFQGFIPGIEMVEKKFEFWKNDEYRDGIIVALDQVMCNDVLFIVAMGIPGFEYGYT